MKEKLILIGLFLSLTASAQTNIVFHKLLSSTNTVLMTNAQFRSFNGDTMIFRDSQFNLYSFHASQLNSNVLIALGTSSEKLEINQQELDTKKQKARESFLASQTAWQKLKLQQDSDAKSAAESARQKRIEMAKSNQPPTVIIQAPRGSDLNDEQKVGAF